ncbi:MAG: HD-GYP domain-containing protein (c-di-GMP phosphodiesterase class II) [Myxococcota bacterium]|jgi:HD-GYP domain-containing protein (c-di-GMP phosphodiesterase class II)
MTPPGGEPKNLTDDARQKAVGLARQVILSLWSAIRVARYHAAENEATRVAAERLQTHLSGLFELQYDVSILFYAHDFHVNDLRVKPEPQTWESFAGFSDDLVKRQVGRLRFATLPDIPTLTTFIAAYNDVLPDVLGDPYVDLTRRLRESEISGVHVDRYVAGDLGGLPVIDKETFVRQSYFRAVQVMRQLYEEAREGRPLSLRLAKRIVQNFVDVLDDPDSAHSELLFLLCDIKNWQGYLFNHAVNTCLLALGTGRELGLEREALRRLGMGAMLADIGNAVLPVELLDAARPLTDEERQLLETHPIRGVPIIARFQEADGVVLRSVIACLFHHRTYQGDGYPAKLDREGDLFAEIVMVCDRYDAMTTARPWRPEPMSPPDAIRTLIAASGTELNPVVVKAFVSWMGTLPAGTVVVLESGEVGMVMSGSRLGSPDSMRVKIIDSAAGSMRADSVIELPPGADRSALKQVMYRSSALINARKVGVMLETREELEARRPRSGLLRDDVYSPD